MVVFEKKTETFESSVEKLVLKDEKDVIKATDLAKSIKEMTKEIEGERDAYVAPAKEIIRIAKDNYDPVIKRAKGITDVLKQKVGAYIQEQNEKKRVAAAKIVGQATSGYIKEETAVQKLEALPEEQSRAVGNAGGQIRVSEYRDWEIEDETLIPREYLVIDRAKIRKAVITDGQEVPGIKVITKTRPSLY